MWGLVSGKPEIDFESCLKLGAITVQGISPKEIS
jgi:hypothetical protein